MEICACPKRSFSGNCLSKSLAGLLLAKSLSDQGNIGYALDVRVIGKQVASVRSVLKMNW